MLPPPRHLKQIVVFRVEDILGRRREMLVASLCYTTGGAAQYLMGASTIEGTVAITGLCVARVLYGVGVGFAMHGAPSYIAETSPSSLRGSLVAGKEAMIVIGMLLGYSLGAACMYTAGDWRYIFLAEVPMGLVFGAGVFFLPPSPRWLALKGNRKSAEESLKFVMPQLSKVHTYFRHHAQAPTPRAPFFSLVLMYCTDFLPLDVKVSNSAIGSWKFIHVLLDFSAA